MLRFGKYLRRTYLGTFAIWFHFGILLVSFFSTTMADNGLSALVASCVPTPTIM